MSLFGIAISTMVGRDDAAMTLAAALEQHVAAITVIVQGCDEDLDELVGGIRVLRRREKGLSKSRNLAVASVSADYVWLLDDDVKVEPEWIRNIVCELESSQADILVGRVRCLENDAFYKKYSSTRLPLRLKVLQVSSIEIVVRKDFVADNGLYFDELLGLGSMLPSGEENCFLLSCVAHNARFRFSPCTFVAHSCEEGNRSILATWNVTGIPFSKGVIARRVGGLLGMVVLGKWLLRAFAAGVSLQQIKEAIDGYIASDPGKYQVSA